MYKSKSEIDENKITLVKKIQLYPNINQQNQLEKDSNNCKILYNTYLAQRKELYNYYGESITLVEQRSQIKKLREDNKEYTQIYAKWLHSVCEDLEMDYKGCIKKRTKGLKSKLPKYKDKNFWYPLKTPKEYVRIRENGIKLGFYEFLIDISQIPSNYREIWITKTRGKYILSIAYEAEKIKNDSKNILAIDLGISKLITGINQNKEVIEIWNPRYDKYWNKKIDKVTSMRDKKNKGSIRYKKLTIL
jgi:putative transposase